MSQIQKPVKPVERYETGSWGYGFYSDGWYYGNGCGMRVPSS